MMSVMGDFINLLILTIYPAHVMILYNLLWQTCRNYFSFYTELLHLLNFFSHFFPIFTILKNMNAKVIQF